MKVGEDPEFGQEGGHGITTRCTLALVDDKEPELSPLLLHPYLVDGTSVTGPYVDRLRDPSVSIVSRQWNVYVTSFYTVEREAAS